MDREIDLWMDWRTMVHSSPQAQVSERANEQMSTAVLVSEVTSAERANQQCEQRRKQTSKWPSTRFRAVLNRSSTIAIEKGDFFHLCHWLFYDASLHLYNRVCPFVRLSVCPSLRIFVCPMSIHWQLWTTNENHCNHVLVMSILVHFGRACFCTILCTPWAAPYHSCHSTHNTV